MWSGGAVYKWMRDDGSAGYVVVDEASEVIRPCNEEGIAMGEMFINRSSGNVENVDPVLRGRFLVVAAAIFKEWGKARCLPDVVTRNYG
jgi:hypothetical protein